MSEQLITSAKRLGWLAQPDFCPRCFHIKKQLKWKAPWAIPMPIYGRLDKLQKRLVQEFIDRFGIGAGWLSSIGEVVGYIDPPHWSKFWYDDPASGVRVRGQADLILRLSNGELFILDLKTSNSIPAEDPLMPTYIVQQSVYAMAAEQRGLGKVAGAGLAYMRTLDQSLDDMLPSPDSGLEMQVGFSVEIHHLPHEPELVRELCQRYRELYELEVPPERREGCKECALVDQFPKAIADTHLATASYAIGKHKPTCVGVKEFMALGMAK